METENEQYISAIKMAANKNGMGLFSSGQNRFDDAIEALAGVFNLNDTLILSYSLLALYYPSYTYQDFTDDIQESLSLSTIDQEAKNEDRASSSDTLISVLIVGDAANLLI